MSVADAVKERPLLMSGPMLLAAKDGTKTQTRRPVKLGDNIEWHVAEHPDGELWPSYNAAPGTAMGEWYWLRCPYGVIGDILWCRETWKPCIPNIICYRADGERREFEGEHLKTITWRDDKWRPSIFLPRWASRLSLRITSLKVERLTDISEADARAEGVDSWFNSLDGRAYDNASKAACRWTKRLNPKASAVTARATFAALWERIHGPRSFNDSTWVWCIGFERV